ncbi:MAG TPA: hypothetical protein VLH19_04145 [Patescibacteria group bacterium]|nr:hypothetical protein [Patescibacteria group bacterium]
MPQEARKQLKEVQQFPEDRDTVIEIEDQDDSKVPLVIRERKHALDRMMAFADSFGGKMRAFFAAMRNPRDSIEQVDALERTIERQEEMYGAWREAQEYVKIDGIIYRIAGEEYGDRIPWSTFKDFFSKSDIPGEKQSLSDVFGGYESNGNYYSARQPLRQEQIAELMKSLFKNEEISRGQVILRFDQMRGHSEYEFVAFVPVEDNEISDAVKQNIYEQHVGNVVTAHALEHDKAKHRPPRPDYPGKEKSMKRK